MINYSIIDWVINARIIYGGTTPGGSFTADTTTVTADDITHTADEV